MKYISLVILSLISLNASATDIKNIFAKLADGSSSVNGIVGIHVRGTYAIRFKQHFDLNSYQGGNGGFISNKGCEIYGRKSDYSKGKSIDVGDTYSAVDYYDDYTYVSIKLRNGLLTPSTIYLQCDKTSEEDDIWNYGLSANGLEKILSNSIEFYKN